MNRYFIAAIPPVYLSNYITGIKEFIALKYNSKAALNQPPHITIVPPFEIEEIREEELTKLLENQVSQFSSLLITLSNYGSFPPKVIFIDVEPNAGLNELAANLNKILQEANLSQSSEFNFHPHVTVAFKDLTEENYNLAWEEYSNKKPYFKWEVDSISLLKYENKQWTVVDNFKLGG